jgi:hypothetical protein
MRRAALVAVVCGLLACKAPVESDEGLDVFVPGAPDASDATAAEGGEAGLAIGQVDRAGRPLVNVLLVPSSQQDSYNEQPSFEGGVPSVIQSGMEARLVELDTLTLGDSGPDPVDWPVPEGGSHPLLAVFLGDTLLVDTSLPCAGADGGFVRSYFELERQTFLGGPAHVTCGGRTPNEDVVDETLQLLVTRDRDGGPVVGQFVLGPTKPSTTTFPYLAPPN